ncbi:hypothetical protein ABEB22_16475 (plasmid) [Thioclava sp. 'Guangxiensis']|uniref:DUF6538 domain-containing protein n=1 Tax=Thioclava sp. 'Guangxiensis' TaxID=3149044 RepID=UPI0032C4A777
MSVKKSKKINKVNASASGVFRRSCNSGSQGDSHRSPKRGQTASRRWGLYLIRRNEVFYFRKRWPQDLCDSGTAAFLSISPRTKILSEAVKRSADLLTAFEAREQKMIHSKLLTSVSERQSLSVQRSLVRAELTAMVTRFDAPYDADESAAYIAEAERQADNAVSAMRARDWTAASTLAATAAAESGLRAEQLSEPGLARSLLRLLRDLKEIAVQVETDCAEPLVLAKPLLESLDLPATAEALKPAMTLCDAIEAAAAKAPGQTQIKIRSLGRLALEFFGDIAVETICYDQSVAFLKRVWSMPRNWGQMHGKNRSEQVGHGKSTYLRFQLTRNERLVCPT